MKTKVYSIRDSKAEAYGQPFLQKTHGEAERTLKELANDPKTFIAKYPTDYDLWYLGEYDDQTGKFELEPAPKHMINAQQLQDREAMPQDFKSQQQLNIASSMN